MEISPRYLLCLILFTAALVAGGCTDKRATTAATPTSRPTSRATTQVESEQMAPTPTPTPEEYLGEVRAVEFSPNRKYLVVGTLRNSASIDGFITVRDCASNRVVKRWKVSGGVRFLAWSPDGKQIAITGADDKILVWNWRTKKLLYQGTLNGGDDNRGRMPLDYSPDGRTIAVGVPNIPLFDTKTWKSRPLKTRNSYIEMANHISYSPDGRTLLISDGFEGVSGFTAYAIPSGKSRDFSYFMPYDEPLFTRDSKLFIGNGAPLETGKGRANMGDGTFVFDTRTLKVKRTLKTEDFFDAQDISPNQQLLVGINGRKVSQVEIWNIVTGKRVRKMDDPAIALVWLDNKTLLAGDVDGVRKLAINRK